MFFSGLPFYVADLKCVIYVFVSGAWKASLWKKVSVGALHSFSGLVGKRKKNHLVLVMVIFIMDHINKTKCALG